MILGIENLLKFYYFCLDLDSPTLNQTEEIYSKNSELNILCEAEGSPKVSYQWFKYSNLVATTSRLNIKNLTNDDSAIYECVANNGIKEERVKISIRIECKTPHSSSQKLFYIKIKFFGRIRKLDNLCGEDVF